MKDIEKPSILLISERASTYSNWLSTTTEEERDEFCLSTFGVKFKYMSREELIRFFNGENL